MALLGMGSNMESNSYFRQCCLTREIGGNGNDRTWPQIVDDKLLNSGRFSNSLFPRLLDDRRLEFNKGVLKQIMLEHESIFRDQIYQLHRLYQRQRDLMAELKFCNYDQHGERTQSNITSSRSSNGYDWKLSISATEKVIVPSIQVERGEKCLHPMHIESESRCRKFGKKILDLELPAEEYVDSEEEWPVKENVAPIISKNALAKNHYTSVLPRSYELLSSTLSGKPKIMADLNEPIKIEDEVASEIPESQSLFEDVKKVGSELPSYNDENEPEKSEKAGGNDVNLNCYMKSMSETQALDDKEVSFGESDRKLLPIGPHFDLNRLRNEDGSSSDDGRSRREKCDEDKLEMSCPKTGQVDGNLQEELVRIAAEVMICISLSDCQTPPRGTSFHLWETPFESLCWFSRIVCSTIADSESKVKSASKSKTSGARVELSENGIDYFEAMTLKLEDMKTDEHFPHNYDVKGEGKSDKPSSNQPLKVRKMRGRQRKDFQSKILPGLVSLSRHEVTEDLQIIGGLMEVAESGTNRSFRRKRQSCLTGSLIKRLSRNGKLGLDYESRVGWGRIRRRQRGRRFPARNPQLILEQILQV